MKPTKKQHLTDATRAIHAGESKPGVSGPVTAPIVRSSTFTFADTAEMKRWAEGRSSAYIYTRYGNPTLAIAEAKLAALEHGEAAVVTASGMAAISSALLAALERMARRPPESLIAMPAPPQDVMRGAAVLRAVLPPLNDRVQALRGDLAQLARLGDEIAQGQKTAKARAAALEARRADLDALLAPTRAARKELTR